MVTRSIVVVSCVLLSIAASAAAAPLQSACKKPDGSEVHIAGGSFRMGSAQYYKEEGPVHDATVAGFSIDRFAITNAQFAKFVKATGYVTDAEKPPKREDYPEVPADKLVAGGAVFSPSDGMRPMDDTADMADWWAFVPGANWRHPSGPNSKIDGMDDYPVVQVSYNDALAYAHWAGRELPTEEQLEFAARGGLDGKDYSWGDELNPGGKQMANTWQGEFPVKNLGLDGFMGVAPVGCFPANGYGLYDMIGNVWEWSKSPYDKNAAPTPPGRLLRTIKGGSFLCAPNYCHRYRPAARQPQESGFSTMHLGFRTVKND